MKKTTLISISMVLASALFGQLVNPGFEVCSAFPSNSGQWQVVQGWNNAGSLVASPDYYHYLGSAEADLPETPIAIVEAYEGDAVMGLIVCGRKQTNLREYISSVFSEPMEIGRDYMISFKITNGLKTAVSTGGLAVQDMGLFFSVAAETQTSQLPIEAVPQFTIDSILYSERWEHINFIFHADQAYRFMTFGLFGDDADKIIVNMGSNEAQYAYYFLDDFSMNIIPNDNTPVIDPGDKENPNPTRPTGQVILDPFYIPNTFTPNGDGSNDLFKPIAGSVKEWEFSIYNRWGSKVFFTADESFGWDGSFNARGSENGAYVWEVVYFVYEDGVGLVRREQRGIVNLVR